MIRVESSLVPLSFDAVSRKFDGTGRPEEYRVEFKVKPDLGPRASEGHTFHFFTHDYDEVVRVRDLLGFRRERFEGPNGVAEHDFPSNPMPRFDLVLARESERDETKRVLERKGVDADRILKELDELRKMRDALIGLGENPPAIAKGATGLPITAAFLAPRSPSRKARQHVERAMIKTLERLEEIAKTDKADTVVIRLGDLKTVLGFVRHVEMLREQSTIDGFDIIRRAYSRTGIDAQKLDFTIGTVAREIADEFSKQITKAHVETSNVEGDARTLAHSYKHDTRPPADVVERSLAYRAGRDV